MFCLADFSESSLVFNLLMIININIQNFVRYLFEDLLAVVFLQSYLTTKNLQEKVFSIVEF